MGGRIAVARDGAVATVVISNPAKKNALNLRLVGELRSAFEALSVEDVRCVVLRGEGTEAFCSGYDITAIPAGGSGEAQVLLPENPFDDMVRAVASFPAPVIAMLNGVAFGGGLEVAVACDLRVSSDQAAFGMTPARLGIIYRPAGLMRFVHAVGLPATKELFYTARRISARRAFDIRLVNRICPPEELEQVAYEMAREIAENAPLSIRGTKRILAMCTASRTLPPPRGGGGGGAYPPLHGERRPRRGEAGVPGEAEAELHGPLRSVRPSRGEWVREAAPAPASVTGFLTGKERPRG